MDESQTGRGVVECVDNDDGDDEWDRGWDGDCGCAMIVEDVGIIACAAREGMGEERKEEMIWGPIL